MNKILSLQAKKSLSQNFLADSHVASRIVNSLNVHENAIVLEVGPGTGSLTRFLLQKKVKLTCVELDQRAVAILHEQFPETSFQNLAIVHSDILEFNIQTLLRELGNRIFVIGNIPYSLTSEILFYLFTNASSIQRAVLMMQKEVAIRLTAKTRTKDYGILSVAAAMCCKPRILFDVKPGSFIPQPKVTSSVVSFDFFEHQPTTEHRNSMMNLIRASFNQRRKKLKNSLVNSPISSFRDIGDCFTHDIFSQRAEELELADFEFILSLTQEYRKVLSL